MGVTVNLHLVAVLPTKEVVDGDVEQLPFDVEECDFDAGQRSVSNLSRASVHVTTLDEAVQAVHVPRVFPFDEFAHLDGHA